MIPGTEPGASVNVFEGCRRIAFAIKVAWLIVVTVFAAVVAGADGQGTRVLAYAAAAAVGGWFFLSVLQAAIGWIARGFAGIPLGHDRRR